MRWPVLAGLAAILIGILGSAAMAAERKLPKSPALLSADRVSYDEELGLVVASGHVEISQDDRILLADTVTYNQRTDSVTASGNVSLLEPDGNVIFASYFELTSGLKDGVAQNFRLLMTDKSRFAAAGARRTGGDLTEMTKGVFSPCDLCKDDPERPPLWQLKAAKIVHDQETHQVYYEDAQLDMYGVPVAYTPYFSHPDPTVKRQSGFLAPRYGRDSQIGTLIQIPYFWAIDDDKDVTVAPIFTTNEGVVFDGEYRQRWGFGKVKFDGSITEADALNDNGDPKPGTQVRGHIRGEGIFNLDENWRTGFGIQRETDQTYLRRYKILYTGVPTVLPTNGYVEGFFGRTYNALNAYTFQDTRPSVDNRTLPVVAPIYEFNYVSEPGSHGQRWRVDANALDLYRSLGADSRRVSQRTQWELPYTSPIGELYTLTLSLQTDGYATMHNINPNNPSALGDEESAGRVLPQGKFEWRYPWVRQGGSISELIEPRVAFITGTQGRNTFLIPNEDSLDFEFDEQNLFSLNPFPGVDRVEGGQRVVYGGTVGAFGAKGGGSSLFLGQQYRLRKDDTFDSTSGLEDNLSDYVGRLQVKPLTFMDFVYRFRLSHKDLSPRRTEVAARAGPQNFKLGVDYISLTQQVPGIGFTHIEQATPNLYYRLNQYWSSNVTGIYDIADHTFRSYGGSLVYADECFTLATTLSRSFTRDRDVQPGTTFLVQLTFKYLGLVQL